MSKLSGMSMNVQHWERSRQEQPACLFRTQLIELRCCCYLVFHFSSAEGTEIRETAIAAGLTAVDRAPDPPDHFCTLQKGSFSLQCHTGNQRGSSLCKVAFSHLASFALSAAVV